MAKNSGKTIRLAEKIFFLLFFLVSTGWVSAQKFIQINGEIQDAHTEQALGFATVKCNKYPIHTLSNLNGEFIYKLPATALNDTVSFSYLGYKTATYSLAELKNNKVIKLEPHSYPIKEIAIEGFSCRNLITKAIENIENNYRIRPYNATAFYRESILEEDLYIQFAEAILSIYKQPYNNKKKDQVKIVKGRKSYQVKPSFLWDYVDITDGIYESLYADVAKYPRRFITLSQNRVNFLSPKFFRLYQYHLVGTQLLNDREVYHIHFEPVAHKKRAVYAGEIWIDKKDYAFVKLNYRFAENRINYGKIWSYETEKALAAENMHLKALQFNNTIQYSFINGTWQFQNSHIQYQFLLTNPHHVITTFTTIIEFMVTETDTVNPVPLKGRNRVRLKENITSQIGEYDYSFWDNYNILKLNDFEYIERLFPLE